MRWIKPGKKTLSAKEIAEIYCEKTGEELHPTNVGNAAKSLNLDYIEIDVEAPSNLKVDAIKQRQYSELDIELIFTKLDELVERRSRFK